MDEFSELPEIISLRCKIGEIREKEKEDTQKIQNEIKDRLEEVKIDADAAVKELTKELVKKQEEFFSLGCFEGYEFTTVKDLCKLSLTQLTFLVYRFFGVHQVTDTSWRGSPLLSRHYVYGDVSVGTLDDKGFNRRLTHWLSQHSCTYCYSVCHTSSQCTSCKYCKSISHTIDVCPKRPAKCCDVCKRYNHDTSECRDVDALRLYCKLTDSQSAPRKYRRHRPRGYHKIHLPPREPLILKTTD